MNTPRIWIFGLTAAMGLALAAPAGAAPDFFMEGAFVVAKREDGADARRDERDARRDKRREAEREEPRGYGYGYERRQQQRFEEDDRPRGRRPGKD